MTYRSDPDDRDPVQYPLCVECNFRIIDEKSILGPYGFVHSTCLPEGSLPEGWPV